MNPEKKVGIISVTPPSVLVDAKKNLKICKQKLAPFL